MRVIDKYKKQPIELLYREDVISLNDKIYVVTDYWYHLKHLRVHWEYRLFCLNDGEINYDLTIIDRGEISTSSIPFEKIRYNMFLGDVIYNIKPTDLNGGDIFLYNDSILIKTNKEGYFDKFGFYYIEVLDYRTKELIPLRLEPYVADIKRYADAYIEVIRNDKR